MNEKELVEKLETLHKSFDEKQKALEQAVKDGAEGAKEQIKKEIEGLLEENKDLYVADQKKLKDEYAQLKAAFTELKENGNPDKLNQSFKARLQKALETDSAAAKILKGESAKGALELKVVGDMTSSSAFTGAVIDQPRVPGIFEPILRETHIRSILPMGSMTGSQIEYDVETGFEGGPARVAEGSAKPQVDYDIAHQTDPAIKLAVFARVTEEMFADKPMFSSYITSRMIGDLLRVEDAKLLYGAGSGDMTGITARTGIIDVETTSFGTAIADATTGQALLSAFAEMAKNNVQVNGALMNPLDKYEMLANIEAGGADVAFNLVYSGDLLTFNGVPIITSTAVTAGDLIVGAWGPSNVQMYQREGLRVEFSTEDATNFTTNKITVRVEERVALAVYRPKAFGYGGIAAIKTALGAIA